MDAQIMINRLGLIPLPVEGGFYRETYRDPQGRKSEIILGTDIMSDHRPQVVVSPLHWQGTRLIANGKWALLGCTVAPAFEFSDFSLGHREKLIAKFPQHENDILRFTRETIS